MLKPESKRLIDVCTHLVNTRKAGEEIHSLAALSNLVFGHKNYFTALKRQNTKPSTILVDYITRRFGVSRDYLLLGVGGMFDDNRDASPCVAPYRIVPVYPFDALPPALLAPGTDEISADFSTGNACAAESFGTSRISDIPCAKTASPTAIYNHSATPNIPSDNSTDANKFSADFSTGNACTAESFGTSRISDIPCAETAARTKRHRSAALDNAAAAETPGKNPTGTPAAPNRRAGIAYYVPFIGAEPADICVHVTESDMQPAYSPGSLLLLRQVDGWRQYFGYGHCYVLILNDGRRILKEVRQSETNPQKFVQCLSSNPRIPPEELPRDFIASVYRVVMMLTREGA